VTPVGVVCGGPSLEHEISLKSGHEVLEHIDRDRFDATPVIIGKRSQWTVGGDEVGDALAGAHAMREVGIDCCFLALHGPYGEDGRVQAFLETCGFRYTGSTPGAMAVSGDKILAKRVVATLGVPLADDRLVPPTRVDEIESTLGYPCVVKDPHQGSTLGMEIVSDRQELNSAVERLGQHCDRLLVEECVRGREFTVSILDLPPDGPRLLPITEIRAKDGYFDFEAKYSETAGAEEICPADLQGEPAKRMREAALTAHIAFGMKHMSRTDFLLRDDGTPVYLETNGIPGMTSRSLYPQACAAAGIGFTELISRLIDAARR
jgi:D-alanine-D-alanine ligase